MIKELYSERQAVAEWLRQMPPAYHRWLESMRDADVKMLKSSRDHDNVTFVQGRLQVLDRMLGLASELERAVPE